MVDTVPSPEVVAVQEAVTGVQQNQRLPAGAKAGPSSYLNILPLTSQNKVLLLSLLIPAQVVSCLGRRDTASADGQTIGGLHKKSSRLLLRTLDGPEMILPQKPKTAGELPLRPHPRRP